MSDTVSRSSYSMSDFRKKEIDHYEAQPIKIACAFCKTWKFEGTVLEARDASRKHKEKKHPETIGIARTRRRSVRSLTSFRTGQMDPESIAEVEAERKKRAYLNGIDITSQM